MYAASTLYHAFQQPRLKNIFRVMDHSAVYLLIGGSYTPFLLLSLEGTWRWVLMAVIWFLALAGVSFKTFTRQRFAKLSVITYILMGWLSLVMIREMLQVLPTGAVIWLAAGGVAYTVGVIFYVLDKRYMHAIWHIFVLAGSLCHFIAVYQYLAPRPG
jgi:hemolysin III